MATYPNPKLKDSIYLNDIFTNKNGDGYWVIGNKESDFQVMIDAKHVPFFKKLMNRLNGKNDIDHLVENKTGSTAEVKEGLQLLGKYGFIEGTESEKSYNEAESLSIKLYKKHFGEIKEYKRVKYQNICKKIILASKIIFGISAITFFVLLALNFSRLILGTSLSYWFSYSSGGTNHVFLGYLLANLGMVVMFGIHELFHVIVGIEKGIQPAYFSFILFLGFIPMFYIKNKNIYSLQKKDILKVLLAGVYSNLILFFIFMNLFIVFDIEFLKILALANLRMGFVNLIPLSLTDGYFIYTLIFNRPNLRMKLHKFLGNPKVIKDYSKREVFYVFLFISTILFMLSMELIWISGDIKVNSIVKILFIVLFNITYLVVLHFLDKKRFSKK